MQRAKLWRAVIELNLVKRPLERPKRMRWDDVVKKKFFLNVLKECLTGRIALDSDEYGVSVVRRDGPKGQMNPRGKM